MKSPYENLPAFAFWRSAMREQSDEAINAIHSPKFQLHQHTRLMTAGSCFAQHLHRALVSLEWSVLQLEAAPGVIMPRIADRFGYGIFSARYGNIYTARQLLELVSEAVGKTSTPALIWEKSGRFYDALRPNVEPEGLAKPEDVMRARQDHLNKVRACLAQAEVLIFTLGLTEAWIDAETGRTLPTAPGTIAGNYDPAKVTFVNFSYTEVLNDLLALQDIFQENGWDIRILLTVSPVPLVATATGTHVGVASTYSKAVLRAVSGELQKSHPSFDYFPSYEIITTQIAGGPYFRANMRDPSQEGIETVLAMFSYVYNIEKEEVFEVITDQKLYQKTEEIQCEEMMLEAFSKR